MASQPTPWATKTIADIANLPTLLDAKLASTDIPVMVLPRSTTAALAAIGNAINTTNKFAGKAVINTTTGAIVTAAAATAAGVWQALDGTTAHTPV